MAGPQVPPRLVSKLGITVVDRLLPRGWLRCTRPATIRDADDHGCVRTLGVEEELLVVDSDGRPVPLGPDALEVASRRGEGENPEEHDRAEREGSQDDDEAPAAHLMPELKAQQLELGTAV